MVVEIPEPAAVERYFGGRIDLARRYTQILATTGIERGLLGPREAPRLWDRHLLNSVVIQELLPDSARLVDVGTGAGLPGLAVAIARPDLRVDLVESLQRRVDFLGETVDELGLSTQVRVVHGRAEDKNVRRQVDEVRWVTARAVAPIDRLVRWCLPLLTPGGELLALKGSSATEELSASAQEIKQAGGINPRVVICGSELETPAHVVVVTRAVYAS